MMKSCSASTDAGHGAISYPIRRDWSCSLHANITVEGTKRETRQLRLCMCTGVEVLDHHHIAGGKRTLSTLRDCYLRAFFLLPPLPDLTNDTLCID